MSDSSRISIGEDVSGFQYTEQNKTLVKKKLVFHASVIFTCVVLVILAALADTQISESLLRMEENPPNFGNTTTTKMKLDFQEKKSTFRILELILKSFISIVTIGTIVALYCYYRAIFMLKILRNFYPRSMSFLSATPLLYKFMIETFICILHVPPTGTDIGISPKAQIIVFLRIYFSERFSHILGGLKIVVFRNYLFGPSKILFHTTNPNFHVH